MFFTKSGRPITYHGNEHIPEPRRKDGTAGKIRSMDTLFEVLLEVWCKNTAYPGCRASYDQENDPTLSLIHISGEDGRKVETQRN